MFGKSILFDLLLVNLAIASFVGLGTYGNIRPAPQYNIICFGEKCWPHHDHGDPQKKKNPRLDTRYRYLSSGKLVELGLGWKRRCAEEEEVERLDVSFLIST